MRAAIALALALIMAMPVQAQTISIPLSPGLSGAYLSARTAARQGDHAQAAQAYLRALEADPGNLTLRTDGMLALAASGDWNRAAELAAAIPEAYPNRDLTNLVLQVERIATGDLIGATEAATDNQGAGPLLDPILLAWLSLAEGNMSAAITQFETVLGSGNPLSELVPYQMALARAAVGDFESAQAIFSGESYGQLRLSVRGIQAHAQILVQLDRQEDALELLDQALSRLANQSLIELQAEIEANPTRPYDFLTDAKEGMAELFFSLARLIGTEGGTTLPLVYARAAHYIDPNHADAVLFAAEALLEGEQYSMAARTFELIGREHPLFVESEIGRSQAMFELGREEAAVEVLQALARDYPDLATVHATLGDTLRRLERFEEAAETYDAAAALIDPSLSRYWFLFYARGISFERSDQWDRAEPDFRHALELSPGEPNVLNYLGYALVEQGRNLDEALQMIEQAAAARPDSGYIVDSLGWVFYRLGRFDEAVAPMERAVELLPNDPIVNDHLGDVYWMVGRFREAEFQWSRALSFGPEADETLRIRRKLEVGLDAVLEAETSDRSAP